MISPVVVAPEPMLRGFFRRACGPGWALVGDAGHFKHPVTAQDISDAVEQAWFVSDALLGADPSLDGYQAWRDARTAEHYEWSFQSAHLPHPERARPVFAGLAADPEAGQQWRDLFTRLRRPSEVFTAKRLTRWGGCLAGPLARPGRSPSRLTWSVLTPTPADGSRSCWLGWTKLH